MLPYTLDNHFTYGYGDGCFNPEDKRPGNFWCKYSRCSREPMNFKDECIATAKLIAAKAAELGRTPYLFLSGGLDSEVMVKAFVEAEVDFKIITFRFLREFNDHEMVLVNEFIRENQLSSKHMYYMMDLVPWLNGTEAEKLAVDAQVCNAGNLPHMKLMSQVWNEFNGLPVLGNGDVYLEKIDGDWKYVELEYMLSWFRHAVLHKIYGAVGFYQFTPEITLSMLREPRLERLGRGEDALANKLHDTSRFVKYLVYLKYWPELKLRPKFSGTEGALKVFNDRTAKLTYNDLVFDDKFVLSYNEFRDMLEPI